MGGGDSQTQRGSVACQELGIHNRRCGLIGVLYLQAYFTSTTRGFWVGSAQFHDALRDRSQQLEGSPLPSKERSVPVVIYRPNAGYYSSLQLLNLVMGPGRCPRSLWRASYRRPQTQTNNATGFGVLDWSYAVDRRAGALMTFRFIF